MMHSLYAIADMGNGNEVLKLYVEELNDVNSDGTIKRAYQLQNINKVPMQNIVKAPVASVRVQGNSPSSLTNTTSANSYTVSQLYDIVKRFDKSFNPSEAGKVINADGTPKVVYHGTSEKFTVFDITKSRSYDEKLNYDMPGFYFSESADESGAYGDSLGQFYINIKNPYGGDTYALAKEKGSFRKAYDYLVEQGYDGIIDNEMGEGFTEYIVFNPNQIKSATDNIGTFDGANNDVRYSVKGTDDILKQNEALQKYTDKLKKLLYRLQRGDYSYFVSKNISKAAEDILSETNSAYSKKKLTDALEGLSEDTQAIIKGAMTFEQFRSKVNELARDVLEEGLKNDSIEYADTKALRNYLRTTAISLSEAERSNLGEEYEQIRRETFGRLRLSKNGTDIGTVYRELSLLYPEFFNDETETNASAQLRRIREVVAHLKSLNENPYDGYMNEASEWLSNVMIDRIYSEGFRSGRNGAKVIFDTKELRKNAIYTLEDIMKTERNWREREYGKMKRAFDEKTKKLFEKKEREIAGSKAEYAEKKERFFKNKEKAENIKTIKLYTERLTVRLIRSTERASVPEYLRKPVAGFLECINYESPRMKEKTMERLSELRQLYTTIQNREVEAELIIDPDLLDNITEIVDEVKALNTKNTSLYDLSYETVETLKRTVIAIDASISSYNQIIVNGREERLDTVAEKVYDDLIKRNAHMVSKIGAIRNTGEFLNVDMLNPWDFFHQMGPTMEGLYNDLREGQNKQIRRNNESELYMEKLMEDCGVKAKEVSGKTAKVYTFKLADGESISLNKSQIMSLYCLSRQAASLRHILNGGIKPSKRKSGLIADVDGKKRIETKQIEELNPVDVTASDIEKIVNTLSEKEKEFAKGVSKFFTTKCAEWGNEVSLELYGYKKFTAGNYFPIVSDKMYVAKDFKAADAASPKIKNAGITKNRLLLAENPIMVEDIFDVYTRHTSTMANYDAYVIPLFNLERVYNSKGLSRDLSAADINEQTLNEHYPKGLAKGKSVRAAIKTRLGGAADKYFTRFMADVNMGSKFEGGSKIANALTRTYKAAAVNFNARVVIQQPISWVRANAFIDFKYMTEGLRRKVDSEIMYEYSPIARWKDWGFFDMDTGKNMKDIITKKKQLSDAGMFFAGFADHVTWKKLWGAVEAEIADKRPDLAEGSVKFYQECGKRFDEIIDRTQVVDSTFHRSQALRSKDGLMKIATSFMSEPTKTYNLLRTAVEDYKLDPTKKGKKMLMRTVKVAIINSILNAIAMGAFDTLKGDEDDEGFYERIFNKKTGREIPEYESKAENIKRRFFWNYVDNQIGDWAGMIPFFKDVYSIVQGNDVNRMDMAPVGDLVDALKILSSDKYTGTYKTANLFAICADCLGIGVKKLKKSVYDVFIKHIIASLNNQALEYRLMKQFYTIDGNFGKYTSLLFDAWRNGNKDQYDEIIGDMIDSGQSPKDIQNSLGRMFREYKKTEEFKNSEGFDVPWDNYVENNDEKEEKFDLSMLNKEQYKVYNDKSVELENSVVDEVEEMGSYFADEKTHKKAISAAYKYTEETAREEAYPQYETDVSWVETVQKAARERVMNEAELIKYKTKYDLNSIAIDKLIAAVKYGVDAQDYLEFKEYAADLHGKNKKAKIQKYLNSQNLSQKEKNYLYYKVMNYKR